MKNIKLTEPEERLIKMISRISEDKIDEWVYISHPVFNKYMKLYRFHWRASRRHNERLLLFSSYGELFVVNENFNGEDKYFYERNPTWDVNNHCYLTHYLFGSRTQGEKTMFQLEDYGEATIYCLKKFKKELIPIIRNDKVDSILT